MKYNMKNIMSRAWTLYRMFQKCVAKFQKSFGECLRQAWAETKSQVAASKNFDKDVANGIVKIISGCAVTIRRAAIAECGRMGWYLDGKTYPIRKEIKRAGFEWDIEARAWFTLDRNVAINFMA